MVKLYSQKIKESRDGIRFLCVLAGGGRRSISISYLFGSHILKKVLCWGGEGGGGSAS